MRGTAGAPSGATTEPLHEAKVPTRSFSWFATSATGTNRNWGALGPRYDNRIVGLGFPADMDCVSNKFRLPGLSTVRHEPSRHRPLKVLLDDALDLLVAAAAAGAGAGDA
jgi:hypothetical protein